MNPTPDFWLANPAKPDDTEFQKSLWINSSHFVSLVRFTVIQVKPPAKQWKKLIPLKGKTEPISYPIMEAYAACIVAVYEVMFWPQPLATKPEIWQKLGQSGLPYISKVQLPRPTGPALYGAFTENVQTTTLIFHCKLQLTAPPPRGCMTRVMMQAYLGDMAERD